LVLNLFYRRVRELNPEPETTMTIPTSDGKNDNFYGPIYASLVCRIEKVTRKFWRAP